MHTCSSLLAGGPFGAPGAGVGRWPALANGYRGRDQRATVIGALDPETAFERSEPVSEPDQAAPVGPGAPDAVVAHLHLQAAVLKAGLDCGAVCLGVFGHVGERFGHHEVRGRLDRSTKAV